MVRRRWPPVAVPAWAERRGGGAPLARCHGERWYSVLLHRIAIKPSCPQRRAIPRIEGLRRPARIFARRESRWFFLSSFRNTGSSKALQNFPAAEVRQKAAGRVCARSFAERAKTSRRYWLSWRSPRSNDLGAPRGGWPAAHCFRDAQSWERGQAVYGEMSKVGSLSAPLTIGRARFELALPPEGTANRPAGGTDLLAAGPCRSSPRPRR